MPRWTLPRRCFKPSVAVATALAFLLQTFPAQQIAQATSLNAELSTTYYQLHPPTSLGRIVDYYSNDMGPGTWDVGQKQEVSPSPKSHVSRPLVILIQDLHVNASAQNTIAKLLEFYDAQGVLPQNILVEGAQGYVDRAILAAIPDDTVKENICQGLLRQGDLTGAEYFAAKKGLPYMLYGAENKKYYKIHKELFQKSYEERTRLAQQLKALEKSLAIAHGRLANRSMKKLAKWRAQYQEGKVNLSDYFSRLENLSRDFKISLDKDYPAMSQLRRLLALEKEAKKLSPKQIKKATESILAPLSGQLSKDEKDLLANLAQRDSGLYYNYLSDLLDAHGSRNTDHGPLSAFLAYQKLFRQTNMAKADVELQRLALKLESLQAQDPAQKNLVNAQRDLTLLQGLLENKVTQEELLELGPRLDALPAILEGLVQAVGLEGFSKQEFKESLQASIDFYMMATVRDKPMVERTLSSFDNAERRAQNAELEEKVDKKLLERETSDEPRATQNRQVAILVAGGFHTSGISQQLKERGISYLVVSPTVEEHTQADSEHYVQKLLEKETLAAGLKSPVAFAAAYAALLEAEGRPLPKGSNIVPKMRELAAQGPETSRFDEQEKYEEIIYQGTRDGHYLFQVTVDGETKERKFPAARSQTRNPLPVKPPQEQSWKVPATVKIIISLSVLATSLLLCFQPEWAVQVMSFVTEVGGKAATDPSAMLAASSPAALVPEFFRLQSSIVRALDLGDGAAAKQEYEKLLAAVEPLSRWTAQASEEDFRAALQAVPGISEDVFANPEAVKVLRDSLIQLGQPSFSARDQGLVIRVVDKVVGQLYPDAREQAAVKEDLLKGIHTPHLMHMVPATLFTQSTPDALALISAKISNLEQTGSAFALTDPHNFSIAIRTDIQDEAVFCSTLMHEIWHRFVFQKRIKAPVYTAHEYEERFSFALEFLERVQWARERGQGATAILGRPEVVQEFREPLLRALYEHGQEIGRQGRLLWGVKPGISDNNAGYFAPEVLLAEARGIYHNHGQNADHLLHPYQGQVAEAALLAGNLDGLQQNDAEVKPLAVMRDFFKVLHDRYAPPSEADRQWLAEWALPRLTTYASARSGERVRLMAQETGMWRLRLVDREAHEAELSMVVPDIFPRLGDGATPEERRQKAYERGLAHELLAISRHIHGKNKAVSVAGEGLGFSSSPKPGAMPLGAFEALCETLLTPWVVARALHLERPDQPHRLIEFERHHGAAQWMGSLFRDRYEVGNDFVAQALLTPLPIHLQYLDSLLYRWAHLNNEKGLATDPRIHDPQLEEAVKESLGDLTDNEAAGWARVMLFAGQFNSDSELLKAVKNQILPTFQRLYEMARKEAELRRTYERMLREDLKKKAQPWTDAVKAKVEQYSQGLPEEVREAIRRQVDRDLNQQLERYMNNLTRSRPAGESYEGQTPGQGQPGAGQTGRQSQGRGQQPSPSSPPNLDQLSQMLQALDRQLDQLDERLQAMTAPLDQLRHDSQAVGEQARDMGRGEAHPEAETARNLHTAAQQVQQNTQEALEQGREVADESNAVNSTMSTVRDGLPSPEQAAEMSPQAAALANQAEQLRQRLTQLQRLANQLEAGAARLEESVEQPEPDTTHTHAQTQHIHETADQMQHTLDRVRGTQRGLNHQIQQLAQAVANLEQSLNRQRGRGETQPAAPEVSDSSPGEGHSTGGEPSAPQPLSLGPLPEAQSLQALLGRPEQPRPSATPKPVKPLFDKAYWEGLKTREELRLKADELTEAERHEYHRLKKLLGPVIKEMTDRAKRFLRFEAGIEKEPNRIRGPILHDVVRGALGLPAYARREETEPIPFILSFVIDRSGSMDENAQAAELKKIELVKILAFVLLETSFNLKDLAESRGWHDLVQFSCSFFGDSDSLEFTHLTSARLPAKRRPRIIMDTLNKLVAQGGTRYSLGLGRAMARLKRARSSASNEPPRKAMVVMTDEQVSEKDLTKVQGITEDAKRHDIPVLLVPLGPILESIRRHGARVVAPDPLDSFPQRTIDVLSTYLRPPEDGGTWSDREQELATATLTRKGTRRAALLFFSWFGWHRPSRWAIDLFAAIYELPESLSLLLVPWWLARHDYRDRHGRFLWSSLISRLIGATLIHGAMFGVSLLTQGDAVGWLLPSYQSSWMALDVWNLTAQLTTNVLAHWLIIMAARRLKLATLTVTAPRAPPAGEPLVPIPGYEQFHFYSQIRDGRRCLVYRREGFPTLVWERGPGGPDVPRVDVAYSDTYEQYLLEIISTLWRPDQTFTSFSSDGRYWLRPLSGIEIELLERDAQDHWQSVALIDRSQPIPSPTTISDDYRVFEAPGGLRWRVTPGPTPQIEIARNGDAFVPVEGWSGSPTQPLRIMESGSRLLIFEAKERQPVVTILQREGSSWQADQSIEWTADDPENEQDGELVDLVGESGTAKGEMLRAVAELMDIPFKATAGHKDLQKEDLTERQSLGVETAGVSRPTPSVLAMSSHRGGLWVLDERQKTGRKTLSTLKGQVAAKTHDWRRPDGKGGTYLSSEPNHPQARLATTANPSTPGYQAASYGDQPMQRRFNEIRITWLPPDEEVQTQITHAKKLATKLGKYKSPDVEKAEEINAQLDLDIKNTVNSLVTWATELRLVYLGCDIGQKEELQASNAGWAKLRDRDFKGKKASVGEELKRPPSPRVIRNMMRHFLLFEHDWKERAWSTLYSLYNFEAEADPNQTYESAHVRTTAEEQTHFPLKDNSTQEQFVLDERSFKVVESDYLQVTPYDNKGQPSQHWDVLKIRLHPEALARQGLPQELKEWLEAWDNALLFYRALQTRMAGADVLFVGEQETGKSKLIRLGQEFLSGRRREQVNMSRQHSPDDFVDRPHLGERGVAFQSGFIELQLPRAMNDQGVGKILNIGETTEAPSGTLSVLNDVSDKRYLLDRAGNPYPHGECFAIWHDLNPPAAGFDVNSLSQEFIERHYVFLAKPLPPEQSHPIVVKAGLKRGIQVNPKLMGDPVLDGSEQPVLVDGQPQWRGLLGVEQEIRRQRAKESGWLPRAPGVGTMKKVARFVRDKFEMCLSLAGPGAKAQRVIFDLFCQAFTLKGEDQAEWYERVKAAFRSAGLWSDDPDKDAVKDFLGQDEVLVEALGELRKPKTRDTELNSLLSFLQQNTRAAVIDVKLTRLSDRVGQLMEKLDEQPFTEQVQRLYVLKEVHQLLGLILTHRGGEAKGAKHSLDHQAQMAELQRQIQGLLVSHDWPVKLLDSTETQEQWLARCTLAPQTGDPLIDRLLSRFEVFRWLMVKKDEEGKEEQKHELESYNARLIVGLQERLEAKAAWTPEEAEKVQIPLRQLITICRADNLIARADRLQRLSDDLTARTVVPKPKPQDWITHRRTTLTEQLVTLKARLAASQAEDPAAREGSATPPANTSERIRELVDEAIRELKSPQSQLRFINQSTGHSALVEVTGVHRMDRTMFEAAHGTTRQCFGQSVAVSPPQSPFTRHNVLELTIPHDLDDPSQIFEYLRQFNPTTNSPQPFRMVTEHAEGLRLRSARLLRETILARPPLAPAQPNVLPINSGTAALGYSEKINLPLINIPVASLQTTFDPLTRTAIFITPDASLTQWRSENPGVPPVFDTNLPGVRALLLSQSEWNSRHQQGPQESSPEAAAAIEKEIATIESDLRDLDRLEVLLIPENTIQGPLDALGKLVRSLERLKAFLARWAELAPLAYAWPPEGLVRTDARIVRLIRLVLLRDQRIRQPKTPAAPRTADTAGWLKAISSPEGVLPEGTRSSPHYLAYSIHRQSTTGHLIAMGGSNGNVGLAVAGDARTHCARQSPSKAAVTAFAWSPDDRYLFAGNQQGGLIVYECRDARGRWKDFDRVLPHPLMVAPALLQKKSSRDQMRVERLETSPDGKWLMASVSYTERGTHKNPKGTTKTYLVRYALDNSQGFRPFAESFSPRSLDHPDVMETEKDPSMPFCFSPEGCLFLPNPKLGSNALTALPMTDEQGIPLSGSLSSLMFKQSIPGPGNRNNIRLLAASRDGRWLAAERAFGSIELYQLREPDGRRRPLFDVLLTPDLLIQLSGEVKSLAFSPDGSALAWTIITPGFEEKEGSLGLCLLDDLSRLPFSVPTLTHVLEPRVGNVEFAGDGMGLSALSRGGTVVWRAPQTWPSGPPETLEDLDHEVREFVTSLTFGPKNRHIMRVERVQDRAFAGGGGGPYYNEDYPRGSGVAIVGEKPGSRRNHVMVVAERVTDPTRLLERLLVWFPLEEEDKRRLGEKIRDILIRLVDATNPPALSVTGALETLRHLEEIGWEPIPWIKPGESREGRLKLFTNHGRDWPKDCHVLFVRQDRGAWTLHMLDQQLTGGEYLVGYLPREGKLKLSSQDDSLKLLTLTLPITADPFVTLTFDELTSATILVLEDNVIKQIEDSKEPLFTHRVLRFQAGRVLLLSRSEWEAHLARVKLARPAPAPTPAVPGLGLPPLVIAFTLFVWARWLLRHLMPQLRKFLSKIFSHHPAQGISGPEQILKALEEGGSSPLATTAGGLDPEPCLLDQLDGIPALAPHELADLQRQRREFLRALAQGHFDKPARAL